MSTPSPELPVFLTVHEVAVMLRLSDKAIYSLVAADASVPVVRLGATIRFPKDRLLAWLRTRESGRAERPIRRPVRSLPKPAADKGRDGA